MGEAITTNLRDELAWAYVFWICRDGRSGDETQIRRWVSEDLAARTDGAWGRLFQLGLSFADVLIAGPLANARGAFA